MKHLKELRLEYKLTQEELGKKTGHSQQAIARYEKDQTETDFYSLLQFADFFRTTTDYLLGRTNFRGLPDYSSRHTISEDEARLIVDYRGLNPEHKEIISSSMSMLRESEKKYHPGR